MTPLTHPTEAGKGAPLSVIDHGKTFLPLLAVQQRSHSIGYHMAVREFSTASEATASSSAARARLRRGPVSIAAPRAFRLAIQPKPMEFEPEFERTVPLDMLKPCSWRFLVALAALRHGQTPKDIVGPIRSKPVTAARHEAVYLVVLHTPYSIARIGKMFNRDHTTLLNSLAKFPHIPRGHRSSVSRAALGLPKPKGDARTKSKLAWRTA